MPTSWSLRCWRKHGCGISMVPRPGSISTEPKARSVPIPLESQQARNRRRLLGDDGELHRILGREYVLHLEVDDLGAVVQRCCCRILVPLVLAIQRIAGGPALPARDADVQQRTEDGLSLPALAAGGDEVSAHLRELETQVWGLIRGLCPRHLRSLAASELHHCGLCGVSRKWLA